MVLSHDDSRISDLVDEIRKITSSSNNFQVISELSSALMKCIAWQSSLDSEEYWFPVSRDNPSKLTAHKFVDGEWVRLSYCKFVPWPERFQIVRDQDSNAALSV